MKIRTMCIVEAVEVRGRPVRREKFKRRQLSVQLYFYSSSFSKNKNMNVAAKYPILLQADRCQTPEAQSFRLKEEMKSGKLINKLKKKTPLTSGFIFNLMSFKKNIN